MITVTPEEITRFRSQLVDNPRALVALDVVEECEGYLDDAVPLLFMRETNQDIDRSLSSLLEKYRQFICKEEIRAFLESGLIAPVVEPLALSTGLPVGTATALSICAFKLIVKGFCEMPKSD